MLFRFTGITEARGGSCSDGSADLHKLQEGCHMRWGIRREWSNSGCSRIVRHSESASRAILQRSRDLVCYRPKCLVLNKLYTRRKILGERAGVWCGTSPPAPLPRGERGGQKEVRPHPCPLPRGEGEGKTTVAGVTQGDARCSLALGPPSLRYGAAGPPSLRYGAAGWYVSPFQGF